MKHVLITVKKHLQESPNLSGSGIIAHIIIKNNGLKIHKKTNLLIQTFL